MSLRPDSETDNYKMQEFRLWYHRNYREGKFYWPWSIPLFNFGVLFGALFFCLYQIESWSLHETVTLIIMLLLGNFAVFFIHKFPLHRRWRWLPFPYQKHTVEHHRYFDFDNYPFEKAMDFDVVFFPWFVITGFVCVGAPLLYFLGSSLFNSDIGWVLAMGGCLYFALYEFVHFSCHLREGHWLIKFTPLSFMHRHHRVHHHYRLMNKYNFGIVLPFADFIMGTRFRGELPPSKVEDYRQNLQENKG